MSATGARLTTHVLDTTRGRPAAGMAVAVHQLVDGVAQLRTAATTNADGRTDVPLLEGDAFGPGAWELTFSVGAYFAAHPLGPLDPEAVPYLDAVPVRFSIGPGAAVHVALLVTPWSYTTYRGS